MKKSLKICITGGPCAGKSSIIASLMSSAPSLYLQVPEIATYCVPIGLRREVPAEQVEFQRLILSLQTAAQSAVHVTASAINRHLLADRGSIDVFAYLDRSAVAKLVPQQFQELRDWYDVVIHLRSLAVDHPEQYSDANNIYRVEGVTQARGLDERLQELWEGHENYYLVKSHQEGVESKLIQVQRIIENHLHLI